MANNQSSNLGSHASDQQLGILKGESTPLIQAAIGSLIFILLTALQVMYQNDDNSPFKTHGPIMKIFIVFAFVHALVAVAAIALQTQYSHCSYVPLLNNLGLVLGAFVCDFLLLILFPAFGYFVLVLCTLTLLILFLKSYRQIFKLILDVAKLAFDGWRDLLRYVYINAWIQQIIIMFLRRIRQTFNLPRSNIIAGFEEGHVSNYDLESNEETS